MGSLSSKPKAPTPVYPIAPAPFMPAPPVAEQNAGQNTQETQEQALADVREQDLLRRSRGRFGTISTSFLGRVSDAHQAGRRKTLLGE